MTFGHSSNIGYVRIDGEWKIINFYCPVFEKEFDSIVNIKYH